MYKWLTFNNQISEKIISTRAKYTFIELVISSCECNYMKVWRVRSTLVHLGEDMWRTLYNSAPYNIIERVRTSLYNSVVVLNTLDNTIQDNSMMGSHDGLKHSDNATVRQSIWLVQ